PGAGVAVDHQRAAADRRAGGGAGVAANDDAAGHHALADRPAAVAADLDLGVHQHAGAVVADVSVEDHPARAADPHAEVVARARVADDDRLLPVERLAEGDVDLPNRQAVAVYLDHVRTALASGSQTRHAGVRTGSSPISSDAIATYSSHSATTSGFVANRSLAKPMPSAVETR